MTALASRLIFDDSDSTSVDLSVIELVDGGLHVLVRRELDDPANKHTTLIS